MGKGQLNTKKIANQGWQGWRVRVVSPVGTVLAGQDLTLDPLAQRLRCQTQEVLNPVLALGLHLVAEYGMWEVQ